MDQTVQGVSDNSNSNISKMVSPKTILPQIVTNGSNIKFQTASQLGAGFGLNRSDSSGSLQKFRNLKNDDKVKRYQIKKSQSKMHFIKPNPLDYYDNNPYIEGSHAYNQSAYTINEQIQEERDTIDSREKPNKTENQFRSIDAEMPSLTDNKLSKQKQSHLKLEPNQNQAVRQRKGSQNLPYLETSIDQIIQIYVGYDNWEKYQNGDTTIQPHTKSRAKLEFKEAFAPQQPKMIKIPSKSRFKSSTGMSHMEQPSQRKIPLSKSTAGMYSSTGMSKSSVVTTKRGFQGHNSQMTNYGSQMSKKTHQTISVNKSEVQHSKFYLQHKAKNSESRNESPERRSVPTKQILNGFNRWNQQIVNQEANMASIKRIYRPKKTKREISHNRVISQSQMKPEQPEQSDFKKALEQAWNINQQQLQSDMETVNHLADKVKLAKKTEPVQQTLTAEYSQVSLQISPQNLNEPEFESNEPESSKGYQIVDIGVDVSKDEIKERMNSDILNQMLSIKKRKEDKVSIRKTNEVALQKFHLAIKNGDLHKNPTSQKLNQIESKILAKIKKVKFTNEQLAKNGGSSKEIQEKNEELKVIEDQLQELQDMIRQNELDIYNQEVRNIKLAAKLKQQSHRLGIQVDEVYQKQKDKSRSDKTLASLKKHFMQKIHQKSGSKVPFKEYINLKHENEFISAVNEKSTIQSDLVHLKDIFESMHEVNKVVVENVTRHFKLKWFQQGKYQTLIDVEHSQATIIQIFDQIAQMVQSSHRKHFDTTNQYETFMMLQGFLDVYLHNKINLVITKKNHGAQILMQFLKLNKSHSGMTFQILQAISLCLRSNDIAEQFVLYEQGGQMTYLKELAERHLQKIKDSPIEEKVKIPKAFQLESYQKSDEISDSYRVIVEYLSAMRMLLAYDVDNVEDCVSGFETFIDQIMVYFCDIHKQLTVGSEIQFLVLSIVRSGFQIKVLLQDQNSQHMQKVCVTIINRVNLKPMYKNMWDIIKKANPMSMSNPTDDDYIKQISYNRVQFTFQTWQLPLQIHQNQRDKNWASQVDKEATNNFKKIKKEFQMAKAHQQMEKEDEFYKFEQKNVIETTSQSDDYVMSDFEEADDDKKKALPN